MEFNSLTYFFFLAAVLVLNAALPRVLRRWLFLIGSYVFYAAWDWRFCGLIAASTLVDYVAGGRIHGGAPRARRWSRQASRARA